MREGERGHVGRDAVERGQGVVDQAQEKVEMATAIHTIS